jgi:hypothetical protein
MIHFRPFAPSFILCLLRADFGKHTVDDEEEKQHHLVCVACIPICGIRFLFTSCQARVTRVKATWRQKQEEMMQLANGFTRVKSLEMVTFVRSFAYCCLKDFSRTCRSLATNMRPPCLRVQSSLISLIPLKDEFVVDFSGQTLLKSIPKNSITLMKRTSSSAECPTDPNLQLSLQRDVNSVDSLRSCNAMNCRPSNWVRSIDQFPVERGKHK